MSKNENGFSLVIVVIFMSIAALFIGYLMGSWLISFLVEEDAAEIAEQEQISPEVNQQLSENNEDEQSAEINNSDNNLTAPTEEERQIAPEQNNQSSTEPAAANNEQNQVQNEQTPSQNASSTESDNSSESTGITGGFGVQIGAFSNYNNALSIKDEVEEMGYQVVITDSSPHQVQVVGYASRDEAETAASELETEGYNGFIVIRE